MLIPRERKILRLIFTLVPHWSVITLNTKSIPGESQNGRFRELREKLLQECITIILGDFYGKTLQNSGEQISPYGRRGYNSGFCSTDGPGTTGTKGLGHW